MSTEGPSWAPLRGLPIVMVVLLVAMTVSVGRASWHASAAATPSPAVGGQEGPPDVLPADLAARLRALAERTGDADGLHVNVAVGYGGRREIVDAVSELLRDADAAGKDLARVADELSVEQISEYLYTRGQPDPDLVIRTSGEQRLSGFLMWQSVYSEFYFTEALWPQFRHIDFLRALRDYSNRNRRWGG